MSVFPGRVTPESMPALLVVHASEVKQGDALLLDGHHYEVFMDAEIVPPPPGERASIYVASAIITYEGSYDGQPFAQWVSYPENERVLVRRPLPVE